MNHILNFVALDFETALPSPNSACAIGLVRVENQKVVDKQYHLIRTPEKRFMFTYIHGIKWSDVAKAPDFGELWPKIQTLFKDVDFVAAHNIGFDLRVLRSCCEHYGITPPNHQYLCTVQLARRVWSIYPTKLNSVCEHLGIQLNHHQALSDAEACAEIVLKALDSEFYLDRSRLLKEL